MYDVGLDKKFPKDRVDGGGGGGGCGDVGVRIVGVVEVSPARDDVVGSILGAAVGADITIGVAVVGVNDANTRVGACVVGCNDGSFISVEGDTVIELGSVGVGVGIGIGLAIGGSCISWTKTFLSTGSER